MMPKMSRLHALQDEAEFAILAPIGEKPIAKNVTCGTPWYQTTDWAQARLRIRRCTDNEHCKMPSIYTLTHLFVAANISDISLMFM